MQEGTAHAMSPYSGLHLTCDAINVMRFLCWVSVSSQGDLSGEKGLGGQAVAVEDVNENKR